MSAAAPTLPHLNADRLRPMIEPARTALLVIDMQKDFAFLVDSDTLTAVLEYLTHS